jgi:hypothetical protein
MKDETSEAIWMHISSSFVASNTVAVIQYRHVYPTHVPAFSEDTSASQYPVYMAFRQWGEQRRTDTAFSYIYKPTLAWVRYIALQRALFHTRSIFALWIWESESCLQFKATPNISASVPLKLLNRRRIHFRGNTQHGKPSNWYASIMVFGHSVHNTLRLF